MNSDLYKNNYRTSSHRLKGRDYSYPGWYFITICTNEHKNLFGKINNAKMQLSSLGEIVKTEWEKTIDIRREIELDEYIIMPNHLHFLVGIDFIHYSKKTDYVKNIAGNYKPKSISTLISGFKSSVASKIRKVLDMDKDYKVWQRNYYDHVVRSFESLEKIRSYIRNNPVSWEEDRYHRK